MKIRLVTAIVPAAGAVAIALAPIAQAAPVAATPIASQHIAPAPQTCTSTAAGSECMSPGNAQINDSPPFVDNFPMYGAFPWIL
ncbi:hypothetical protein ACWDTP_19245 [Mycobacterium sp. NPDC003449]